MTDQQPLSAEEKLEQAYVDMMTRARSMLDRARSGTVPRLQELVDGAKEKAVELGELSREEAERIAGYLRRDVHDAAAYLSDTGMGLREWLRFDMAFIESRLAEIFSDMVDHTRLELELAARAERSADVRTGEVASPGTLACAACGKELHFHSTGHVPPCPKCHGTQFLRPGS